MTQILVDRLHLVMQKLIKQNQASFVDRRNMSDNIVVTQEAIHTIKTMKTMKCWMVIKVDLEKTYNRIRWDFFEGTLVDAGFPSSLAS